MNAETKQPTSLWWAEPRWSYRPRLKKEMGEVFQVKVWLRIVAISILLTVLIAFCVKRVIPDFEFDWVGYLAYSIGGLVFALVCFFGLHWLIPPIIAISANGVSRLQGQHRFRADIRRILIDTAEPARPRLNIEAAGKKPFECGIAGKVNTAALAAFLRATFPESAVEVKQ